MLVNDIDIDHWPTWRHFSYNRGKKKSDSATSI